MAGRTGVSGLKEGGHRVPEELSGLLGRSSQGEVVDQIYLGTRHPQRLQERIELVRGSAGSGDVHADEPDPGSGSNRGDTPPDSDEM